MTTQLIRCPVCLASQAVKKPEPGKQLHCTNCERDFKLEKGLPLKRMDLIKYHAKLITNPADLESPDTNWSTWILGLLILLTVIGGTRSITAGVSTAAFSVYYAVSFLIIYITVYILSIYRTSRYIALIGLLIFESIGVTRFFTASNVAPTLMIFIMLVGAALFLAKHLVISNGFIPFGGYDKR